MTCFECVGLSCTTAGCAALAGGNDYSATATNQTTADEEKKKEWSRALFIRLYRSIFPPRARHRSLYDQTQEENRNYPLAPQVDSSRSASGEERAALPREGCLSWLPLVCSAEAPSKCAAGARVRSLFLFLVTNLHEPADGLRFLGGIYCIGKQKCISSLACVR